MNLPNMLTVFRFGLIPIYWSVFFSELSGRLYWALIVVLLAGLTDVADGYLARKNNQITKVGIVLDPFADKCMLIVVFLSLFLSEVISMEITIAIVIREVAMIVLSGYFHFRGKKTVPANLLGKLTSVLSYVSLVLLMLKIPFGTPLLWLTIVLAYLTSVNYIFQFRSLNRSL